MAAVTAPSGQIVDAPLREIEPVGRPGGDWRPLAVLAVMLAAIGADLMYITRGATFYYDEWSFIVDRRGLSAHTLFSPHNEHVSTVPILIWKALLHTVGLTHYWPYQVLPIGLELVIAVLVYALARPKIGAWAALVPAMLVAGFGGAWQDILWPFQIGYMLPLATMLGALLLLRSGTLRGDLAACALLIVGTFSSSVGLPLDGAVACGLLLDRRRWVRIGRTAVLPIVLYGAWSAGWGVVTVHWRSALTVPAHVLDRLAQNLAALTGTPHRYGAALLIAVLGVLVFHALTRREVSGTMVAAGAGVLVVWVAAAMFRAGAPSRYFHVPGVLLVVMIVEVIAAYRLPPRLSLRVGAPCGVALAVVMAGQAHAYLHGARLFREWGRFTNSSVAALQIAGPRADPAFRPDPVRMPQVTELKYAAVVKAFGSPAPGATQLLRLPEDARENADSVLAAALGIRPVPAPRPTRSCRFIAPAPRGTEVRLPDAGLWFRGPSGTIVRLRRFGGRYPPRGLPPGHAIFAIWVIPSEHRVFLPTPVYHLPARGVEIVPGTDGAPQVPWIAQVSGAPRVELCSLS